MEKKYGSNGKQAKFNTNVADCHSVNKRRFFRDKFIQKWVIFTSVIVKSFHYFCPSWHLDIVKSLE
jgi:hypothetical protein